jgi:hypothetical protein
LYDLAEREGTILDSLFLVNQCLIFYLTFKVT